MTKIRIASQWNIFWKLQKVSKGGVLGRFKVEQTCKFAEKNLNGFFQGVLVHFSQHFSAAVFRFIFRKWEEHGAAWYVFSVFTKLLLPFVFCEIISIKILEYSQANIPWDVGFNSFHVTGLFQYPLKTSENQKFSYVFRG